MTRIIILGAILCFYGISFGQSNDHGAPKSYTFKISSTIDPDQVKLIQSQLEGYFDGIPEYNVSNKTFHIQSNGVVETERIEGALLELNYSLTYFSIDGTEVNIEE